MSLYQETTDIRACRALWTAVLTTVLRDLCGPLTYTLKRDPDRQEAENWVGTYPRRDFRIVCDGAGLDPQAVHDRLTAFIALPVEERRKHLHTQGIRAVAKTQRREPNGRSRI